MPPWVTAVLVGCAVVLTAVLVPTIVALRRTLRRAEVVLTIAEQELRPLIGQIHGITEEVRQLTHEARLEAVRVGEVTEHLQAVSGGLARLVVGLSGLARIGEVVGVAGSLRRGIEVFVQRLRRG